MKKLILFVSLLLMAGMASAQLRKFAVPVSVNAIGDPTASSAGVEISYLVTSTTPVLATDHDDTTFTEGLVCWVIMPATAAATTSFLVMRDTATANITSTHLVPGIAPLLNTANENQTMYFNPPIPFYHGLSLNIGMSTQLTAAASGTEFAVGIRWKKQ